MTTALERIRTHLNGRYDVTDNPFNGGGSGLVYWAHPVGDPSVTLVLKVLRDEVSEDPDDYSRFKHEIRLSQQFDHPHVMPLIDHGETEDGDLWYLAPRADTNLDDEVRHASMKVDDAIAVLEHIASGVQYVHHQEAVHRDLSPSNIMRLDGRWVIADFGLARSERVRRTFRTDRSVERFGTQDFVSPEQYRSLRAATARSDIYSLGRLLEFMLAGAVGPGAPQRSVPLRVTILRATAPSPTDRFETPTELVAAAKREQTTPTALNLSDADRAERYIEQLRRRQLAPAETLALLEWLTDRDLEEDHERTWLIKATSALDARSVAFVARLDVTLVRRVVRHLRDAIDLHRFRLDTGLDRLGNSLLRIAASVRDPEVHRIVVETVAVLGATHNRWAVRTTLGNFLQRRQDSELLIAAVEGLRASGEAEWVLEETNIDSLPTELRLRVRELVRRDTP